MVGKEGKTEARTGYECWIRCYSVMGWWPNEVAVARSLAAKL